MAGGEGSERGGRGRAEHDRSGAATWVELDAAVQQAHDADHVAVDVVDLELGTDAGQADDGRVGGRTGHRDLQGYANTARPTKRPGVGRVRRF